MAAVYNKALNKTVHVERIIGKVTGNNPGPTFVVFAGIHGNETSGIFALTEVLNTLNPENVNGNVFAIAGNLEALNAHQRYVDQDLNRLWTPENIAAIQKKTNTNTDEKELILLLDLLNDLLTINEPPFYFIDLHSTSSRTLPFITINDALINRKFSKQFPVPIVLGIEEYLSGPLLSYINQLGYVSLGFESGQHDDINTIINNVSFLNLALVYSGVLEETSVPNFEHYYNSLRARANNIQYFLEIIHLHKIKAGERFKMLNGFKSFQAIKKDVPLAVSNGLNVFSKYNGLIFMPLYQKQGSEGFFIARVIEPFYLRLSTFLRRIKFDRLLVALPGISWFNKLEGTLKVNLNVAKYFAKSLFHLLGYRSRFTDKTHLRLNNRERVAKTYMYKNQAWYN
ncbi:succinylglutamate desuccinylase/aspartoacylase family protein [Seonamhaeicola marinus]|uniref:Succinylglutamate desuccinylase/aspartoacylase family protein n=1 Tax=Seonamhaeicola marinus TaxID=1912246 RepID=A0A5D0HXL6_9FLAO|nr:succinylglutamate desuccinylase/aspartoacylase family protein [Seonamhaeicola marinus]TYA74192.1 succinylglutamate desuccinylase/aspartoacylase family protein [Seonamhaeicola marinus]